MLWLKVLSNFGIGFVILMSGAIAGVYYVLKYDDGSSIKNKIVQLETKKDETKKRILSLESEIKEIREVSETINRTGDEFNKFLRLIPEKLTSSIVLNHLNSLVKKSGVSLKDIRSHNRAEKKDFYEKIKISITVEGFYNQVLYFLSHLTSLEEIITVDNLTMTKTKKRRKGRDVNNFGEIEMRMDIYGYRYVVPVAENKSKKKRGS